MSDDDDYVLEDSRQRVGNCLMFWKKDRMGYCCDLQEAHRFTKVEALRQALRRPTDIPRRLSDMQSIQSHTVDFQRLERLEQQS